MSNVALCNVDSERNCSSESRANLMIQKTAERWDPEMPPTAPICQKVLPNEMNFMTFQFLHLQEGLVYCLVYCRMTFGLTASIFGALPLSHRNQTNKRTPRRETNLELQFQNVSADETWDTKDQISVGSTLYNSSGGIFWVLALKCRWKNNFSLVREPTNCLFRAKLVLLQHSQNSLFWSCSLGQRQVIRGPITPAVSPDQLNIIDTKFVQTQ